MLQARRARLPPLTHSQSQAAGSGGEAAAPAQPPPAGAGAAAGAGAGAGAVSFLLPALAPLAVPYTNEKAAAGLVLLTLAPGLVLFLPLPRSLLVAGCCVLTAWDCVLLCKVVECQRLYAPKAELFGGGRGASP